MMVNLVIQRKIFSLLSNISYVVASNLINLLFSLLLILVFPKIVGIEEYGYLQLYIFYIGYVGFLHFGWIDGIYLRYGGKEYRELNKNLLNSQFIMLLGFQVAISLIVCGFAFMESDERRLFILQMVAIASVFVNIRYFFSYILQATSMIKKYAAINILDRISFVIIIFILFSAGLKDINFIILADLIGKIISLIYVLYCCKDIAFRKLSEFYFSVGEMKENLRAGMKLMFANIASILIIGNVRFGIERVWDVSTFGKISLTLNISSLMMLFINAIGVVMFPILRRIDENKLPQIYVMVREVLMTILLGAMVIYFPLKYLITAWLPQYSETIFFMAILFPSFLYEGKMALLINTYLKTLRKERLMLRVNLIVMIISIVITIGTVLVFKSLYAAIVSIIVLLALKAIISEILLSRILNISLLRDILLELFISILFILVAINLHAWVAVIVYILTYACYLKYKSKDLFKSINFIRQLIKL